MCSFISLRLFVYKLNEKKFEQRNLQAIKSNIEGNYELGSVWKENLMTYCQFLSHILSRQTEEFMNIISVNDIFNFVLFYDALSKS
jgi:hypothetical protein